VENSASVNYSVDERQALRNVQREICIVRNKNVCRCLLRNCAYISQSRPVHKLCTFRPFYPVNNSRLLKKCMANL
jgi:hypothetical protein